jgi:phosphoketolase
MRSYKPEELFDAGGALVAELRELTPTGNRRMGANLHANGGFLKKALRLPDFRDYAIQFDKPGQIEAENTKPLGGGRCDGGNSECAATLHSKVRGRTSPCCKAVTV